MGEKGFGCFICIFVVSEFEFIDFVIIVVEVWFDDVCWVLCCGGLCLCCEWIESIDGDVYLWCVWFIFMELLLFVGIVLL